MTAVKSHSNCVCHSCDADLLLCASQRRYVSLQHTLFSGTCSLIQQEVLEVSRLNSNVTLRFVLASHKHSNWFVWDFRVYLHFDGYNALHVQEYSAAASRAPRVGSTAPGQSAATGSMLPPLPPAAVAVDEDDEDGNAHAGPSTSKAASARGTFHRDVFSYNI